MNHLLNLIKKELKELLTPGTFVSLAIMLVVLVSVGSMMGSQTESINEPSKIGIMNADTSTGAIPLSGDVVLWVQNEYDPSLEGNVVIITTGNTERELIKAMEDNELDTLLVIENGFNARINSTPGEKGVISIYWYQRDTGLFSSLSTLTAYETVAFISGEVSKALMSSTTLDPEFVMSPIGTAGSTILNGSVKNGVTPSDVYNAVYAQTMFIPIMIMMIVITVGGTIIGSIGNEKENKTMETLLTLPVKRTTIVGGKLIGSAVVGLIYGALYMVGIYFMNSSTIHSGDVSLNDLGLALSALDWLTVIAMLFLAILCALGICMIMGAFAKNYKTAQTMTLPLSVMAMVPMFIIMFSSFQALPGMLQAVTFAIPFSHPMMVMQNLMFGETAIVVAGLIYLAAFAAVTMYITVRLYRSDILITGLLRKKKPQK